MKSCLAWLPLASENGIAYFFLIAAIIVLTMTMLLRIYRYQTRRRGTTRPARVSALETASPRAAPPDSVVRWEVQMQELARDLKGEIDSKMVALGHLIREADRAAERLEQALEAASSSSPPIPPAGKDDLSPSRRELDEEELRDEIYLLADYGFSLRDISSRLSISAEEIQLILRHRQEQKR